MAAADPVISSLSLISLGSDVFEEVGSKYFIIMLNFSSHVRMFENVFLLLDYVFKSLRCELLTKQFTMSFLTYELFLT